MVRVDPLSLYKKLMDIGPELDIDLKLASSIHKDAHLGHANALEQIREVFNLRGLEQKGLTETETFGLLNHFLTFAGCIRRTMEGYVKTCQGNIALYALLVGRKPTYAEHCGFLLNQQMILHKQAGAVLIGVLTALGGLDPGMNFWRAITEGEGQALSLKGQLQAARQLG